MMRLSVIVPVYNVEKFLPRCLDSLLRQGMRAGEYEVICVNDGSPDNSAAILAEYEAKYPDIFKVITQKNWGLGEARNTGMKVAQGEWIGFVDSDDYVVDGAYKQICHQFLDDTIDVLQFRYTNMHSLSADKVQYDSVPSDGRIVFEGNGFEAYNKVIFVNVWSKIYRRSFLLQHDICFKSRYFEDEIFNFTVFGYNPRTRALSHNLYRYETAEYSSITRTRDKKWVILHVQAFLQNLRVLNDYIASGREEMRPGVLQRINDVLDFFFKKTTYVCFSYCEWRSVMMELHEMPINQIDSHVSTLLENIVIIMKNLSGRFYFVYLLRVLYRKTCA